MTRSADLEALLQKIAEYAFQVLEADRCAIQLTDDFGLLHPKISRDRRGERASSDIPQSIARMAVDDKVAVLSDDAGDDQRFQGQSVVLQKVKSAICVPLIGSENRVLGVLYVDNFSLKRFNEMDLDFLIAFSGIAAVAIENGQLAVRIRQEALARSNFERFFTPHLAARIASSPDAVKLGGDKRKVAVLFSDIRGFTALSETMSADTMAKLLTEYFTEMVECVFRHGGTLDKFIGDGMMAVWGTPVTSPDDALMAVRAAEEMRKALDLIVNAARRRRSEAPLRVGCGIATGHVIAGAMGAQRRQDFTVIGDTVNLSSRLCSQAEPGQVLLCEETERRVSGAIRANALPPRSVKGFARMVPVFELPRSENSRPR